MGTLAEKGRRHGFPAETFERQGTLDWGLPGNAKEGRRKARNPFFVGRSLLIGPKSNIFSRLIFVGSPSGQNGPTHAWST